jgi:hypothetical protein
MIVKQKHNEVCGKFLWVLFSIAKMLLVSGRPTLQVREDYDSLQYAANTLILFDLQSYILKLLSLVFFSLIIQALIEIISVGHLPRVYPDTAHLRPVS